MARTFKAVASRAIRRDGADFQWQRNYYEHIVRSENELARIREYIANNPAQWVLDRENPAVVGAPFMAP
jgi:REP element-mobilizing transposase RayT